MSEFNITYLKQLAHGYVGLPFPKKLTVTANEEDRIGKAAIGRSVLGKPLFMDLVLDGEYIPNEPLITISSQKRIVETVVIGLGRKGTVKELIAAGDFKLRIEGVLWDQNHPKQYPVDQVATLGRICEKLDAIEVQCELTDLFDIYKIVIKSYGFSNMQGQPYAQKYFIDAVSDEDFYGILNDKE